MGARNTLNNISVLVFCYIFCWLPFHLYQLFQINGLNVTNDTCTNIEETVKILAWSHACMNPILYGIKGSHFRKRLRNAYTTLTGKRKNQRQKFGVSRTEYTSMKISTRSKKS